MYVLAFSNEGCLASLRLLFTVKHNLNTCHCLGEDGAVGSVSRNGFPESEEMHLRIIAHVANLRPRDVSQFAFLPTVCRRQFPSSSVAFGF